MISRLGSAVLLASALLLWPLAPARAELPSGGVYVTTLPGGADIWIDGTYVGHSPVLVDELLSGHHAITLAKAGWNVQEVDVNISPSAVTMSSTRLVPGPRAMAGTANGTVIVRGTPSGPLWLDDAAWNGDPRQPIKLAAGTHRLAFATARGRMTQAFTVYPDTTTQVVLREPPTGGEERSGVVAPAEDYLPASAFSVDGKRIVVHYAGHHVVANLGDAALHYDGSVETYPAAPEAIGGKLYLPLGLLEKLTADPSNKK